MEKLSAQPWHDELKRYQTEFKRWTERGNDIVKRYRDERKDTQDNARFNIFWSNVQTLKPAIFSKPPMPEVSRRYNDADPVSRAASTILERALDYEIKQYDDFILSISHVVDDRLLAGRGVAWLRYEPIIEQIEPTQISDVIEAGDQSQDENGLAGEYPEVYEQITTERTPVDYVYWQDFAHLPARTWDEVTWVGRRVYLGLDEGVERFGDIFKAVPLTTSPDKRDDEKSTTNELKKAEVWEIWDKPKKCVYWVAKGFDQVLDHKPDPLELENFFPCPRPLFATMTTGTLVPVADFILYQDQANEIDNITDRINHLTRSLKVMGIYAADEPDLQRLLKEGQDATLIPVKNWGAFSEKGGLQGAIQFVPLGDVIAALQQLYQAREACKQIVYEVTGMSDIMRGASVAAESATAQQIKAQFASLRLSTMKNEMARFVRDILRIKAEIMCSKYQPETLIALSGIAFTPDAQLIPQAIQLLQNEPLRNFQIDIEADTLVELDMQQEKQDRLEFLSATGGFLKQAVEAAQGNPGLVPLLGEMLLFGIRGFKIGREMEGSFEKYLEIAKQKAQQPAPPQPSPEMVKAQSQIQADQAKAQANMQIEQQKLQFESQLEQSRLQQEKQIEEMKLQFEVYKAQLQAQTDLQIAQIKGNQL